MANLIEELSSQARTLPAADRVRLAEELLATVHEPDDEVEAAWDEEIRIRIPDGHPKLLHLWPVKLLQAGRTDGDYTGVAVMREAASFNR